ncbi:LysR family transcriptional regulator [Aquamicrobium sp. LC103]|uniref:LysR family transcriptional regulator n=1 Tax=Aquamicrobium sp. LC103 TaxID=1120658 RepID=UPI00069ACA5B|nr:LysR family transcriptional regulator [Aquamicrobium sp. LC103]TKT75870.1 LysR family transcriptional regulator [Aquamicrobium sp. LC103]
MAGKQQRETPQDGEPVLSLRQIEVFHAVVLARSITGASKVLNVSQPSLSRTIRRMEDLLGVELFARERGGLIPTSEALLIFGEVDNIVRQISGLSGQIARITRGEATVFRVGATASVARALVPQALKALSVSVPSLELFFDVLAVDQMEDYLVTGRGECLVTIAKMQHPLIASEQVGKAGLVAIVPRDHALASRDAISAQDLKGVDFIAFPGGGAHHIVVDKFLKDANVSVNIKAVVRFSDTALALANQGMGVALVDALTAMGPIGNDVVVKRIEKSPDFDISVLWNRKRPRSNNLKKLIDILHRRLDEPDLIARGLEACHEGMTGE